MLKKLILLLAAAAGCYFVATRVFNLDLGLPEAIDETLEASRASVAEALTQPIDRAKDAAAASDAATQRRFEAAERALEGR